MNKSTTNFESELRVSAKPLILILAILGWMFGLLSDFFPDPMRIADLLLLLFALLAILWLLGTWKPYVGRWFAVLTLITMCAGRKCRPFCNVSNHPVLC